MSRPLNVTPDPDPDVVHRDIAVVVPRDPEELRQELATFIVDRALDGMYPTVGQVVDWLRGESRGWNAGDLLRALAGRHPREQPDPSIVVMGERVVAADGLSDDEWDAELLRRERARQTTETGANDE